MKFYVKKEDQSGAQVTLTAPGAANGHAGPGAAPIIQGGLPPPPGQGAVSDAEMGDSGPSGAESHNPGHNRESNGLPPAIGPPPSRKGSVNSGKGGKSPTIRASSVALKGPPNSGGVTPTGGSKGPGAHGEKGEKGAEKGSKGAGSYAKDSGKDGKDGGKDHYGKEGGKKGKDYGKDYGKDSYGKDSYGKGKDGKDAKGKDGKGKKGKDKGKGANAIPLGPLLSGDGYGAPPGHHPSQSSSAPPGYGAPPSAHHGAPPPHHGAPPPGAHHYPGAPPPTHGAPPPVYGAPIGAPPGVTTAKGGTQYANTGKSNAGKGPGGKPGAPGPPPPGAPGVFPGPPPGIEGIPAVKGKRVEVTTHKDGKFQRIFIFFIKENNN